MSNKKHHTFKDYIYSTYSIKNSGTASSYLKAIQILDELFQIKDIFNLMVSPSVRLRILI